MIIDSPTVSPKLSSKEKVGERNYYKKNNNVEKFTHEKLPKVNVVVMHDTFESLGILTSQHFAGLVGKQVTFGLEAEFFHFTTFQVAPQLPR